MGSLTSTESGGSGSEGPISRLSWVERAKFATIRGFLATLAWALSLSGLYRFGQLFGTIEYLLQYRRRRIFAERLKAIYNGAITASETRRHTWRHFCRLRCDKFFYTIFDKLPHRKILSRVTFDGRQILDAALERGKGVYLLFSHHGAHHVGACLLCLSGYRLTGVRDARESTLRRYISNRFSTSFPEFQEVRIFHNNAFPRELFRSFHENRVVGSALDVERLRHSQLKTVEVDIFGKPQEFLTGTLQIALRCQASVVTGFMVCESGYRFRFIFRPVESENGKADEMAVVERIMQEYAGRIEEFVLAHPDHISRTK